LSAVYAKNDKAEVKNLIEKAFQITLSVVLACAICYVVFGRQILEFLYGKTLNDSELLISTKLLFLGVINLVFLSLVYVSASVLQAIGKQKQAAKSILIGSAVKIVLTAILVSLKNINILGAMISGGVSYVVVFLINYRYIKNETEARMSNLLLGLAVQELFVCLVAFFGNFVLGLNFGSKTALFIGGIASVLVFMVSYYFLFLSNTRKKISS
jgi:O-antigen/teichoic acid export membrane protein